MAKDADNIYFKRLLNMVPAHMTNRQEEEEEQKGSEGELETEWEPEPPAKKKKKQQKSASDKQQKSASDNQENVTSAREEKIQGKKESKQKKKKNKEKAGGSKINVQEAQERLRARIAELQAKRGQSLTGAEAQERKRLERKQRKLNGRTKQKNKKKDAGSGDALTNGGDVPSQQPIVPKPVKPVRTKEGKLVFSKFDFTQSGEKERKSELVGKDYRQILARLEKREATVAKVKETDQEAATNLEQKYIWQDVMAKAKGEKIKDDKGKVKKALQRKEKMKEKRKKVWGERKASEEKFMQKRQDKRQENLQKRKDDKKAKHRKKLIKKGRILPGF